LKNILTIIIPTYNRYHNLFRILDYYESFNFPAKIYILDSSDNICKNLQLQALLRSEDIKYLKLPSNFSVNKKISVSIENIVTPYSVLCADDDFITPRGLEKSIDFLESNFDYSSAQGAYTSFSFNDRDLDGTGIFMGLRNDINAETPGERIIQHFSKYYNHYYAVQRTKNWQMFSNVVQSAEFTALNLNSLGELLHSYISVITGKHKALPLFYAARERDNFSHAQSFNIPIDAIMTDSKYSDISTLLTESLSLMLSKIQGLDKSIAKLQILAGYDAYLHVYFPSHKARKNKVFTIYPFAKNKEAKNDYLQIIHHIKKHIEKTQVQPQIPIVPQPKKLTGHFKSNGRLHEIKPIYGQSLKNSICKNSQFQIAENDYLKRIERDFLDYNAFAQLGHLYLQISNYKLAIVIFRKAIFIQLTHDSNNISDDIYACLGISYAKIGYFIDAAACFERCSDQKNPNNKYLGILRNLLRQNGYVPILAEIDLRYKKQFQKQPQINKLNQLFKQLSICFIFDNYTYVIGTLAYLDTIVKMMKLGWMTYKYPIILVHDKCPNSCYLNYWKRYFPAMIKDNDIKKSLLPLTSIVEINSYYKMPNGQMMEQIEAATHIQKQWIRERRSHLLKLYDSDNTRGRDCLRKMGVPDDAWFVAVHVREGIERGSEIRDSDIKSYMLAFETIVKKGGWMIRMGGPKMSKLPPLPNVVDYVHTSFKSDWMDVFLWAKCKFYLGTQSGPSHIPQTFGVPSIMTNCVPLADRPWSNDLFIPKLIWTDEHKRFLSFSEMLNTPIGHAYSPQTIMTHKCRLIDNSPEDINEVVLEMLRILDGTQVYTQEDNNYQNKFNNLEINIVRKGQKIRGLARIGQNFIKKYNYLLEG